MLDRMRQWLTPVVLVGGTEEFEMGTAVWLLPIPKRQQDEEELVTDGSQVWEPGEAENVLNMLSSVGMWGFR